RRILAFRIRQEMAEAEVAVFAAVEAPEEEAVDAFEVAREAFEPVLHDRGLSLSARADHRGNARFVAMQGVVEKPQFRLASEEAGRVRRAVMDRGRTRHERGPRKIRLGQ